MQRIQEMQISLTLRGISGADGFQAEGAGGSKGIGADLLVVALLDLQGGAEHIGDSQTCHIEGLAGSCAKNVGSVADHGEGGMDIAVVDDVAVDLVGHYKYLVPLADLSHLGQLFLCPHTAYRVAFLAAGELMTSEEPLPISLFLIVHTKRRTHP